MRLWPLLFCRYACASSALQVISTGVGRERATRCSPGFRSARVHRIRPTSRSRVSLPQINQREEDQSDDQQSGRLLPPSHRRSLWISGQANFIFQAHNPFHSPYSGTNSFQSRVETDCALACAHPLHGNQTHPLDRIHLRCGRDRGKGLSEALGIAAFTNLDVVRNPSLGQDVYAARYFIHETFPLTAERWRKQPNPFYLQKSIPRRRIEFTMGKLGLVDFFDLNSVGSDSHLQFTNWAIDNNGAYDYAANTRGYTVAAILSYTGPKLEARFGEALMPTVANGIEPPGRPAQSSSRQPRVGLETAMVSGPGDRHPATRLSKPRQYGRLWPGHRGLPAGPQQGS